MSDMPIAISPLVTAGGGRDTDGWRLAPDESYAFGRVRVEDVNHLAKVTVQFSDENDGRGLMGTRHGRTAVSDGRLVVGAGPREWFVVGPAGTGSRIIEEVEAGASTVSGLVTATDVTHGRCLIKLTGPGLPDLMARITAMDLDDAFVPDGSALRTSVLGVVCDLIRSDANDQVAYFLHCERSSGRYLVDELRTVAEGI